MSGIIQYCLLIIAVSISGSLSEDPQHDIRAVCYNPGGIPGVCINIRRCKSLLDMLQRTPHSPEELKFLQESQCGTEGPHDPKVCCTDIVYLPETTVKPVTQVTSAPKHVLCHNPRGAEGLCINIRECPELLTLLQSNPLTPENRKFLLDSQCGTAVPHEGRTDPKVCCPGAITIELRPSLK